MNDRSNKYSNDPGKEREEREKYETKNIDNNDPINRDTNRRSEDNEHEDSEKKGFMDKIMDFFSPDDDSNRTNRDQNTGSVDSDDTFDNEDVISDPMTIPNIEIRDSGMLESESDFDSDSDDSVKKDKDVLVGIFDTENEAINVITRLNEIGYWEDEISAVAKDKNRMDFFDNATDINTKTRGGEGKAGTGAHAIGDSLGGLAVALPALGLVEIPGFGPIFAAGPITSVLGEVATGGVTGELVEGLVQMGVREEDVKEYEQYIKQGKIMILVENRNSRQEEVTQTFTQNNSVISYQSRTRELAGSRV